MPIWFAPRRTAAPAATMLPLKSTAPPACTSSEPGALRVAPSATITCPWCRADPELGEDTCACGPVDTRSMAVPSGTCSASLEVRVVPAALTVDVLSSETLPLATSMTSGADSETPGATSTLSELTATEVEAGPNVRMPPSRIDAAPRLSSCCASMVTAPSVETPACWLTISVLEGWPEPADWPLPVDRSKAAPRPPAAADALSVPARLRDRPT